MLDIMYGTGQKLLTPFRKRSQTAVVNFCGSKLHDSTDWTL
jgi:hypothetical protein